MLTADEKAYMHDTLHYLKGCKGRNCTLRRNGHDIASDPINWNHRVIKKKFDVLGEFYHFMTEDIKLYTFIYKYFPIRLAGPGRHFVDRERRRRKMNK